jgi:hypothetical protein
MEDDILQVITVLSRKSTGSVCVQPCLSTESIAAEELDLAGQAFP